MSGTAGRKTGSASPTPRKARTKQPEVPAVPVSIVVAAGSGDRRAALEALRDKLARDLDEAPASVSAQLAAQFRATVAELAELPVPGERSVVDDLERRRADRRAAAAKVVGS